MSISNQHDDLDPQRRMIQHDNSTEWLQSPATQPPTEPAPGATAPLPGQRAVTVGYSRRCPTCGAAASAYQTLCPQCGTRQRTRTEHIRCRHCGRRSSSQLVLCAHCGRELQAAPSPLLTWGLPSVLVLLFIVVLSGAFGTSNSPGWFQRQLNGSLQVINSIAITPVRAEEDPLAADAGDAGSALVALRPLAPPTEDTPSPTQPVQAPPVGDLGTIESESAAPIEAATGEADEDQASVVVATAIASREAAETQAAITAETEMPAPVEATPTPEATAPDIAESMTTTATLAAETAPETVPVTATLTTANPIADVSSPVITGTVMVTSAQASTPFPTVTVGQTTTPAQASTPARTATPVQTGTPLRTATPSLTMTASPAVTPTQTITPSQGLAISLDSAGESPGNEDANSVPTANAIASPNASVISTPAAGVPMTITLSPTETPVPFQTYTVRAGDTLVEISEQYGVSVEELMAANNLTAAAAANLAVGRVLILPGVASSEAGPMQTYVVRSGDTFVNIALRFNVEVAALLRANGWTINSARELQVGQTILIPDSNSANNALPIYSVPTSVRPTVTPTPGPVEYTVRAGDTVVSIAQRFGITTQALMSFNDLTEADARRLQPGDILLIPPTNQP